MTLLPFSAKIEGPHVVVNAINLPARDHAFDP